MGIQEIGKKINKICLSRSDGGRRWYVKQEMGHGNQVENRTSVVFDKLWLEASLRSARLHWTGLLSGCWADIYYRSWCTVRLSFVFWRQSRGPNDLDFRDNVGEFNHGSVNLSLFLVTQTRCPETPGQLRVCMLTVVEHRLSDTKPGSSLKLMSQWHTHCRAGSLNIRQRKMLDQDSLCDSSAMLPSASLSLSLWVEANLANSSGPTRSSPLLSLSDSAFGVSPGPSCSQGLHS